MAAAPTRRLRVLQRRLVQTLALASAAGLAQAATAAPPAMASGVADLGLQLLRQAPPGGNVVVSPVAVAAALGMLHAGTSGPAEHEIEALFGPRAAAGSAPFKQRLPALLQQLGANPGAAGSSAPPAGAMAGSSAPPVAPMAGSSASPAAPMAGSSASPAALMTGSSASPAVLMAGRVWIDSSVAPAVPAAFTQRLATRYGADAARLSFADSEAARGQINTWTAAHTNGRIPELLPAGSVSDATQLTITAAIHFRSAWAAAFDAGATAPRPFQPASGASVSVPTMLDERVVRQTRAAGALILELPFAGNSHALLVAVPQDGAAADALPALLQGLNGSALARWRAALQPQKCALALPRFTIQPQAMALKPALQALGMRTAFETSADLRPMLGRAAPGVHVGDVLQAAGITIDEQGGEAVAASAVTVQAKTLAMPEPPPPCAVDRAFVFAVMHVASGTPLFVGRVADPRSAP